MEVLVIVLGIVLVILGGYLFFMHKELKRIKGELNVKRTTSTNTLIHTEFVSKSLNELVDVINKSWEDIQKKEIELRVENSSLMVMIRNISHDLRTPLTSALGYIDLVQNSRLSEEDKKHYILVIEERLKRLNELIDSFFLFSKVVSIGEKVVLEEVNLVAVLEECIARYYDDFLRAQRSIVFKNDLKRCYSLLNKEMLMRIFDNLIMNAFKHSKSDLIITVSLEEVLRICFVNELLEEDLDIEHIFDEFYTVDISRTKGNNGLGLAIAREFTQNLGGCIYAEKKSGKLEIVIEFKGTNLK